MDKFEFFTGTLFGSVIIYTNQTERNGDGRIDRTGLNFPSPETAHP
jgi:hypothetical protein